MKQHLKLLAEEEKAILNFKKYIQKVIIIDDGIKVTKLRNLHRVELLQFLNTQTYIFLIAAKNLTQMLIFGTIDEGINLLVSLFNKLQSKASFIFPEKRDTNANLLRQFSLQWIIHNVPLKDGIQMSYEEFRSAIQRFSRYYNENSLEQQLKDFYDTAVNVWQKFKQPPSTEEIKHALLEIAAKTLDKDLQKKDILKSDVGFGEGLFKIAKDFYEEKKQMSENSLIKNVFESFEGILEKEKHYVEVCQDYYSFLKDFINVHFPTKKDKKNERFYSKVYKFTIGNYLKLVSLPLYTIEDVIDLFLSESTQNIVANNFREKRNQVQNNQVQQLQLQIQILGIKGFLIWKRFYNSYKVYRGFSSSERVQLLGLYGLLNEVKLLIPVFNPNSVRVKKMKEFYEVKVKKTLIQHYKQILYYHGIIKKEWVIFQIKSLNQIKDLIKTLQIKVEQVNHRANKLYQEALEYVQSRRRQILQQNYDETQTQENDYLIQDIQEERIIIVSEQQIDQGVASPVVNEDSSNDNSYNEEEKNNDNHYQAESIVMEKVAESAQELEGSCEDSQIKSGNQSQIKKNDSVDLLNQNQQQVVSSEEDNPAVTVNSFDYTSQNQNPKRSQNLQNSKRMSNDVEHGDEEIEEEEKHQNSDEKRQHEYNFYSVSKKQEKGVEEDNNDECSAVEQATQIE